MVDLELIQGQNQGAMMKQHQARIQMEEETNGTKLQRTGKLGTSAEGHMMT